MSSPEIKEDRPLSQVEAVIVQTANPDQIALEGLAGIARPKPKKIMQLKNPPEDGWELIDA